MNHHIELLKRLGSKDPEIVAKARVEWQAIIHEPIMKVIESATEEDVKQIGRSVGLLLTHLGVEVVFSESAETGDMQR